ncbi:MAG: hypothetical protein AAF228_11015, partial [Pseudomonadota bacterium]
MPSNPLVLWQEEKLNPGIAMADISSTPADLAAEYFTPEMADHFHEILDTQADWVGALTSVYGDRIDDNLA